MRALHELSTEDYRHDVISGNVGDYIAPGMYCEIELATVNLTTPVEYSKARKFLGEVSDVWAGIQYSQRATPWWDILYGMMGDLPVASILF
jgi:hypothetical protein